MQIPTDLASLLEFIRQHGSASYTIMFSYAASHSLLFTLFAGYATFSGALDFTTLVLVCWAGSFLGDVVRFWIARRYGERLLKWAPSLDKPVRVAARLAEKHHAWMILLHRYPYGLRGVAAFAYGLSGLGWRSFVVFSAVAAGAWAVAVVSLGYAFGRLSEQMLSNASSWLGLGMLAIFLALSWALSRKLEQAIVRG